MNVDVAVVGAGSAGAAAALDCARRGMSVVCLEAGPLEQAGACWINGIPGWMFDAAGIPRPTDDELVANPQAHHTFAGWGPERVTVPEAAFLQVDMRRLVTRLQRSAAEAGARLLPETKGKSLEELETVLAR